MVEYTSDGFPKKENPYEALAAGFVGSVLAGNRGRIGGGNFDLHERLREYAYYRMENATGAADALLVNDLLDAAKRLTPNDSATPAGEE